MKRIDSTQNQSIKEWAKLKQKKERDRTGLFLIEGDHLIQEASKMGIIEVLLSDQEMEEENGILVTPAILKKLSQNPSGAHRIAVCRQWSQPIKRSHRLLLLDDIQDPGNLGTIIRTAVSFEFDGIICSAATCDLYNEKVIRATQGALFQIPIEKRNLSTTIPTLIQEGVTVIATALENAKPMHDIPAQEKMAFVLGNEGSGVHPDIQALCQERLRIEMNGFESLNVAIAGGILMYHYQEKL